jgi:glycosyltransferase involved in cell wall biosynthesis
LIIKENSINYTTTKSDPIKMKSPTINCSLVITTYNWPRALKKVLQSVAWQSILPGEVLIADDGSSEDTADFIKDVRATFPIAIKHFWQEDIKKRKTRINNIAIANAAHEYLIFIDHDMVLHPRFLEDHLSLAKPGYFINGSRFLVNKQSTDLLLAKETITPFDLNKLKGKNNLNRIRIPALMSFLADRYQTQDNKAHIVRGCNMAFWKTDLFAVNGYDERYQGWGREDSDIAIRLFNNGIKKRAIKFGGIGYHLQHKEGNKTDDDLYVRMMTHAIETKSKWAETGLNQHLNF